MLKLIPLGKIKMKLVALLLLGLYHAATASPSVKSNISVSTSSFGGVYAPGDIIFQDEFDYLNLDVWHHEVQMNGGGNNEFQIYTKDPANSYVRDGILYVAPTQTADKYGEDFLYSGTINLEGCTDDFGCAECCGRTAHGDYIMQPVLSARLRTKSSFSFTYGKVEVRARISLGDWVWPAIWLLPESSVYGQWPKSGEIDLMESRGNNALWGANNGPHIGVEQVVSTLHFGPEGYNGFMKAHWEKQAVPEQGFDQDFHLYQLEWTPDYMKFSMDNVEYGIVRPNNGGFFELGGFPNNVPNPWAQAPNFKMAPFDQKFHFLLNVAVGGDFFPEDAYCPYGKPWSRYSDKQYLEFWRGKNNWQPTWHEERVALAVDYIRVWAV